MQSILREPGPLNNTRTRRPKIISIRTEGHIRRIIKISPKTSYLELKERCAIDYSEDKIYNYRLERHYMKERLAKKKKRLKVTKEKAKKR